MLECYCTFEKNVIVENFKNIFPFFFQSTQYGLGKEQEEGGKNCQLRQGTLTRQRGA